MMTDRSSRKPEISFVIPCYNEQENIRDIISAVIRESEAINLHFEIIIIDNSSSDNTVTIAKELCAGDIRIKLIVNTRNFGQMRSPTHAILAANGRAVIGMCADFQDPPEMIGQFVDAWRAGYPIVLGVRRKERGTLTKELWRNMFYKIAHRLGDYPIIPDATGFGLYDAKVVDAIRQLDEPEPFFRGLLVETGYKIKIIEYDRPERRAGKSSNNFAVLLDFALSGLTGSSKKLVRLPFFVGAFAMLASGLAFVGAIISLILGQNPFPWIWALFFQTQFAMIFIFIGLMGDQIRFISERTRKTPLVIEKDRVNFLSEE